MASSLEYVQHVAAQLSGAGAISYKNYLASMACGAGERSLERLRITSFI